METLTRIAEAFHFDPLLAVLFGVIIWWMYKHAQEDIARENKYLEITTKLIAADEKITLMIGFQEKRIDELKEA